MKLLFQQRLFSWFDSYDIYQENGSIFCTVKGQLSWGHCLKLFHPAGQEIGTVKERILTLLPRFELYEGDRYCGCIRKEFTWFRPRYHIECNDWQVEGDFLEWDYQVYTHDGSLVATIRKELFHWTDTYSLSITRPEDALVVLMLVLAIDAEKCSR